MKTPTVVVAVALLALAGCIGRESADKPAGRTPPVLKGVLVPELARVLDTSSTGEAARVTLSIEWPAESVAAFYGRELPKAGFRIVSDQTDGGVRTLLAQRDGPPLWVQITPGRVANTARFTLIGAVQDTAKVKPSEGAAGGAPK